MLKSVGNKHLKLSSRLYKFNAKRFLSFEEARSQILSHPVIQKHTKNLDKLEIENVNSLTECYHNFLSPNLNKLNEKEILELQTYVLEKASLFEFGISDFLLREIINSKDLDNKQISESTLANILKRNPGRRVSHLEYLGDLKKLNIDIMEKNNKLLAFTLEKIVEASDAAENEELVRHLTQAVYVFINMSEETLLAQVSNLNISGLINKIIDSNLSKLLELVLEKLLTIKSSNELLQYLQSIDSTTLTLYQQFLINRFQLLSTIDSIDADLLVKYLHSVKINGPFFKLTDGETIAQGVSEDEEQVLYRELSLNKKLEISKTKNYYTDVIQNCEDFKLSQIIKSSEGEADYERILYLNDPTQFSSLNKKFDNEFEKAFRYYHSAIINNSSVSLVDIKDHFKQINQKNLNDVELSKIHQLEMLAASCVDSSEEAKDYIIDLSNENIAAYLKTENSLDFIRAFIVSILMTKDLDLANYIKEGFYNNGSITKTEIKQMGKFFVKYGELTEEEQKSGVQEPFERQMKDLVITDIVNRI